MGGIQGQKKIKSKKGPSVEREGGTEGSGKWKWSKLQKRRKVWKKKNSLPRTEKRPGGSARKKKRKETINWGLRKGQST